MPEWGRKGRSEGTRSFGRRYRAGRAIKAGRVWVNQYHSYPAHAAFGGYKHSGIGRENHLMVLDHYRETKNLLESYSESPTGLSHSSRCVARCRRGWASLRVCL